MRQKLLEEYKKTLVISVLQKEVLIGLLLGDGHIEISPNRKSARLKVEYSAKHSDYVSFLYQIFQKVVRMEPKERRVEGFGKKFPRIGFTTLSLPDFLYYRDLFYPNKIKIIPSNLSELLTEIGLAVWFMDDGSYKSRECKGKLLCTHSFSDFEVKFLCEILKEKFSIEANLRKQKDGNEIYIHASSYEKLKSIVFPYLVSSFKYKLDN